MNPTVINNVNSGIASDAWYGVIVGFSVALLEVAVGCAAWTELVVADDVGDGRVDEDSVLVGDGVTLGGAVWIGESGIAGAVGSGEFKKGV
jgi:hypothetical protein